MYVCMYVCMYIYVCGEMRTKVLPAPQGNTIKPERARPCENILESDFS